MTGEQLQKVVPTLEPKRAAYLADKINFIAPVYRMYTPDILHEFIANIAHESGGFRLKAENMNYSVSRLRQVWPSRFKDAVTAALYAHNPQALANLVYGSRMGNKPGTNDGYDFRGGGFIQLTGRDMYTRYANHLGVAPTVAAHLVREDDYYALDSAFWLFAIEKKLIMYAVSDNFERVVRGINGGVIGLTDRKVYYERAKKYIV